MRMNIVKPLTSLLVFIVFFTSLSGTGAAASLDDGEYEINFKAMHLTEEKESQAQQTVVNPARLEVTNGSITAFITLTGSQIRVENSSGEFVAAEVVAEDGDKKTYKVSVANIDDPVIVEIHVAQAGIDVQYRIVFEQSTLKKLAEGTSSSSTGGDASSGEKVTSPETGDSFSSTMAGLGAMLVLLLAATAVIQWRKKRFAENL
ncbi:LPXTG-motif cell wall anchor domain-containing protein [Evansella caseinilytica]|uniref:LPXTG-motif cell wall anchor domain-containing protein n=1 Tax=Evansella caseinilytica TaxID=1503961 RepID=A0A1H3SBK0_9BACI|nr:NEAT domain-containing protein [Evansella caseinilytica]SDZ35483.1 LPXTG-motif cell wall anchor domain-containing protein [Evansella caseinilytica]